MALQSAFKLVSRTWTRINVLAELIPKLGFVRVALWTWHKVQLRAGIYRYRTPAQTWAEYQAGSSVSSALALFIPPPERIDPSVLVEADRICRGTVRCFSWHDVSLSELWNPSPSPLLHWASVDLSATDPKLTWEPSRFQWILVLLRAWALTRDDKYAAAIRDHLELWQRHADPNRGVAWACGQECSIRIATLCHLIAFCEAAAIPVPENVAPIVAALAERIEPVIPYAFAQRNNHGLSESLGLFLAGLSLPSHPRSQRWIRKGYQGFLREAKDQFASDGTYLLNSLNYHREAMRITLVFLLACRRSKRPVPDFLKRRLKTAVHFLYSLQDSHTGRVPQYGPDDGSDLFVMGASQYSDFRPLLQTLYYEISGERFLDPGPWDQELDWYFGPSAAATVSRGATAAPPTISAWEQGGYYAIRSSHSHVMLRCHTHRARPGHADMLHLDLWHRGKNVLGDGGTYSYNDPDRIGERLKGTAAHNTVVIGGRDQMTPLGRFLWSDWTEAKRIATAGDRVWRGEHYGYLRAGRGWVHCREVTFHQNDWLILDELRSVDGSSVEKVEWFWHLNEGEWISSEQGATSPDLGLHLAAWSNHPMRILFQKGSESNPLTARSEYYGKLRHAPLVSLCGKTAIGLRTITVVSETPAYFAHGKVHWSGGVREL